MYMDHIIVVSCVSGKGEPIPTETLSEQQRQDLSRWLRQTWLTELCRGRAEISWRQKKDPAK